MTLESSAGISGRATCGAAGCLSSTSVMSFTKSVAANGVAAETADLVIASAEADPEMPVSGQMLKIRSMPERSGEDDDSIYRYDRAALLTALRVHASRRKA